jgi:AraC-like DNA-binding protein
VYNSPAGVVRLVRGDLDVPVQVRASSFLEGFVRVGFENGDCTGPPWLMNLPPTSSPPFFREAGVGPPSILYVAGGSRTTRSIASKWVIPPGGAAECQPQAAAAEDVLPAVEALAARACLCPRHFSRLFKEVFRTTPAEFVQQLRLGEARLVFGGIVVALATYWIFDLSVVVLLFACIFKFLPDAKIQWRDVWAGATLTAFLFALGKWAIGLYLASGSAASAYGAASSLITLLLWVYYSAQILLFGAEFTQVFANHAGRGVAPDKNAVRVEVKEVEAAG